VSRHSVTRYWHLLRYHRPSQFARRAISHVRRRMLRKSRGGRFARPLQQTPALRSNSPLLSVANRKLSNRRKQGACARADAILAGRFCFLNKTLDLSDPVDWRLSRHSDVDPLWRFHLHYQEYLLDLLADDAPGRAAAAHVRTWELIRQWIAGNSLTDPRTHVDGWHPFCISRRLPVWIAVWQVAPPSDEMAAAFLESTFRQGRFLASHLERDLGGNHLIENAHALALAAVFFDGAEADGWLRIARKIFERELPEQILEHGEHFERSPMYHAQMLDALLDIRDGARNLDSQLARSCGDAAARMAGFLEQILHPDGEIPLLGDSAFGESPPPGELIRQAIQTGNEPRQPASNVSLTRRAGDYWTFREGSDFLLLDGGPVGPDHLPAHAHSDLTTFEFSIGGRRLVVDSGVFAYSDDELRRYCRSTGAHNVLQIDDCEQCDTWSRFRMGYRGRPVSMESGSAFGFDWARVRHNAFRRIGVPEVGRWVACRRGGPWLIVDWADGRGSHWLTNRLHLHPDVNIEDVSANLVELRLGSELVRLGSLTPGKLEIEGGYYCPEFGHQLPAQIVCWTSRLELPGACGWWFDRSPTAGTASLKQFPIAGDALHWHWGAEQIIWQAADILGLRSRNHRLGIEQ
jgi:uncharacterized heparinase superfamily protein